ncbi:uncharacterized protein YebE (UPF0316 family) [Scopulibacillus darangshiensis]|uniref:UPF0316 protein EV207_12717 n=1 Tax=Scopulibacillus darangshiensis TaxID=442528 RepID=A0A4R2NRN7_9BACL|nr:DUF2179 domain-containing protein [Scopulibacillus darangshiensis]TCP24094.1 uncharacterized protein YebE (UPF0316 family) [Scopulibacillus darangshiensis]
MLSNTFAMVAIIFVINIVYVSFNTIRMILTLKGYRYYAASLSMVEVLVYVLGLGLVINNLDQIQNLIAYALGYGSGVIIGMKIEEKLALGYITVNVITAELEKDLPNYLRNRGYGVTHWTAHGRKGERLMMEILTPRRNEFDLIDAVKSYDPVAFIVSQEPKSFRGGFWVKSIRKSMRP